MNMSNYTEGDRIEIFYNYLYGDITGKLVLFSNLILSSVIGPILMFGIVIFEMFGGDSQKRTIVNRLLSALLINASIAIILTGIIRTIRDAVGLLDYNQALFLRLLVRFFVNSAYIFYNILTVFRYLLIVVWKRMRGVQDTFWAFFFFFSVYTIEVWHISLLFMTNFNPNEESIIHLSQEPENNAKNGKDSLPSDSSTDRVRNYEGPRILFLGVTAVVLLSCNVHIVYRKLRQCKEEKNTERNRPVRIFLNSNPISDSNNDAEIPIQNHNTSLKLNTTAYNKMLAEIKHTVCFCVCVVFFMALRASRNHLITDWDGDNPSKILLYTLDFGPRILFSFVFPLMFYCSHPELRTYWKNTFKICRKNQA